MAVHLGVDESTLRDWEHGRSPLKKNMEKLEAFFKSLLNWAEFGDAGQSTGSHVTRGRTTFLLTGLFLPAFNQMR
jgi:ribosome-binding protein aMBF1 (putative translation factor)